jgi:hypothetical protein
MIEASNPIRANQASIGRNESDLDNNRNGLTHRMMVLLEKADGNSIDSGTVISVVSGGSHAVLMVFLSFPLYIPAGIPVLSTSLGLALSLVGFLMASGRAIWIPKRIAAKVVPYDRLSHVIEHLPGVSSRTDRWFHPRMPFFAKNSSMMRVHGIGVMLLGLVSAVPLPLPFNNFVAAFPVLLLGLSLLEKDGLLAIVSYIATIPFFIYYSALLYLGNAGFRHLIGL